MKERDSIRWGVLEYVRGRVLLGETGGRAEAPAGADKLAAAAARVTGGEGAGLGGVGAGGGFGAGGGVGAGGGLGAGGGVAARGGVGAGGGGSARVCVGEFIAGGVGGGTGTQLAAIYPVVVLPEPKKTAEALLSVRECPRLTGGDGGGGLCLPLSRSSAH